MDDVVILSMARTPQGRYLGGLATVTAPRLAAVALKAAVERGGLKPESVDEVVLGCVVQAGVGQAPARQAALLAGIPGSASALTVNMVCGSGLRAVMIARDLVQSGDADVVAAGGMESMSNAPHFLRQGRAGWKYGDQTLVDAVAHDGLTCASHLVAMGCHAEHTAKQLSISRGDQDAFAERSQRLAANAARAGLFNAELVPVVLTDGREPKVVDRDEGIRPETSPEGLAKLKPVFEPTGSVTAGNSSPLSDGAAAVVVTSASWAGRHGFQPLARIVACASTAVDPRDLFIAPVPAMNKALARAQLSWNDIDAIELNEAFAAQVLACVKLLSLPLDKVNTHGGAIALGHPIGASGARVLVTLLARLDQIGGRYGIASLCLGGGGAVAMIVERIR